MVSERLVWVYFISRNSSKGKLRNTCRLWYRKPMRERGDTYVQWLPTNRADNGYIGEYFLNDVQRWFRTYPETDLELIRVETYPTDKQIREAK
jgi:hypothetical protein